MAYNAFFRGKKADIELRRWRERRDITFQVTYGTPRLNGFQIQQGKSHTGAIRENFCSSFRRIVIAICRYRRS